MSSFNRKCTRFLANYDHDGSNWGVDIYAYDWEDAAERCRKLNLNLDGEFVMAVPARMGWFAKASCRIRNFFHSLRSAH